MFVLLLAVNLAVALVVTVLVILAFRGPIAGILSRIVQDPIAAAWRRYLVFALLVVGVSSGVNPWTLERYTKAGIPQVAPPGEPIPAIALDADAWALEVYRTAMSSLRGLTWALFLFFAIGLVLSAVLRLAAEQRPGAGRTTSVLRQPSEGIRSREMGASRSGRDRPPPRRQGIDSRRRGSGEGRGGEGRGGEGRGGEGRGGEGRGGERRGGDERGREEPMRGGTMSESRPEDSGSVRRVAGREGPRLWGRDQRRQPEFQQPELPEFPAERPEAETELQRPAPRMRRP